MGLIKNSRHELEQQIETLGKIIQDKSYLLSMEYLLGENYQSRQHKQSLMSTTLGVEKFLPKQASLRKSLNDPILSSTLNQATQSTSRLESIVSSAETLYKEEKGYLEKAMLL